MVPLLGAQSAKSFNPLPPPKRGETRAHEGTGTGTWEVSIHSPRRSEGRLCSPKTLMRRLRPTFQSTPPAEARGDKSDNQHHATSSCFNPLPPPKRGETVSFFDGTNTAFPFQSTPPAEARGDPPRCVRTYLPIEFQSTPPAEARGDVKMMQGHS